jgi:hypothetical protein
LTPDSRSEDSVKLGDTGLQFLHHRGRLRLAVLDVDPFAFPLIRDGLARGGAHRLVMLTSRSLGRLLGEAESLLL